MQNKPAIESEREPGTSATHVPADRGKPDPRSQVRFAGYSPYTLVMSTVALHLTTVAPSFNWLATLIALGSLILSIPECARSKLAISASGISVFAIIAAVWPTAQVSTSLLL